MPGFLIGVGLHVVCIPVLAFVALIGESVFVRGEDYHVLPTMVILLAGIFQVFYLVPAHFVARHRGARKGVLKGLFLSGVLLFLLNAGFCGTMRMG